METGGPGSFPAGELAARHGAGAARPARDAAGLPLARDLVTAAGLAAGPMVALGLARFAYALLLPSMQAALHWSFATAALMNTANAAGYLAGALAAAPLARRLGPRQAFAGSLAVTSALLLASAATGNLAALLALRALAGLASAAAFIVGGALTARLGHGRPASRAALLLGVYYGGGGLGVVASGLVVPAILAGAGPGPGWRWGWAALAAMGALASAAALPALRRAPVLEPAGGTAGRLRLRPVSALAAAYCLYGAGYIAYMTFIIAYLKSGGAGTGEVTAFWTVLGLAAVAGAFAWGPLLSRLPDGRGVAVMVAVTGAGAALPLLTRTPTAAFASAAAFGGCFLAVVSAVTNAVRHAMAPAQWTAAIAVLTTAFALGQCAGPVLSGLLADTPAGVHAGLWLSVAVLAACALACLACRPRPAAGPGG